MKTKANNISKGEHMRVLAADFEDDLYAMYLLEQLDECDKGRVWVYEDEFELL